MDASSPDTDEQDMPKRRITKSQRAGLVFPVGRVHRKLKTKLPRNWRIGERAPVFLAAALQTMCEVLVARAIDVTRDEKRKRITPDVLLRAMEESDDFRRLKRDAWVLHAVEYPPYHKEEKERRDILAIRKAILGAGKRDLDAKKRAYQEMQDNVLPLEKNRRPALPPRKKTKNEHP